MSEVDEMFQELNKRVLDLYDTLNMLIDEGQDAEHAGRCLVLLHELKGNISDVYSMYSARVIDVLHRAHVDGLNLEGATIEVKGASDRKKWNHSDIAQEVSRRIIQSSIDIDTGEVLLSPQEIAVKMLDYMQPSYWRIKELSKIGINADNYCEVGEYKENIIIRKAK